MTAKKTTRKPAVKQKQPAQTIPVFEPSHLLQDEIASVWTDYIRQYVGSAMTDPTPSSGVFLNKDRVYTSQYYEELAQFDLYAEVERDPHIVGVLPGMKMAVAGMKWDMSPYSESGDEGDASDKDIEIATFVRRVIKNIPAFPQQLYNLMGALGMGFAVSEIIPDVASWGTIVKAIYNRPQRRFQFDAGTREIKLRNLRNPFYGDPLPQNRFIVHRIFSTWENPFGDALDQSLYWPWLFKRMIMKFSVKHLEVGASSVPIVEHPANATDAMKAEASDIAESLRNGAFGRIPDNFKILWAESQNAIANADAYNAGIRLCNEEMSKCVAGQTLTTDASSAGGKGTRALGEVHRDTQSLRTIYHAEALANTLNASLVKFIVDENYLHVEGYPEFRFDLEESDDLLKESNIVKNLSGGGYYVDTNQLSEKFNYTITRGPAPITENSLMTQTDGGENANP